MKSYEGLFIFPPESTPDVRKNQLKNLDELIAKFKGQIQQKKDWGKKPLGYIIRKFQEGYFLVYDFQMDPSQATEFRKGLELQEDLIKFMVTLKKVVKEEKKPASKPAATAPSHASAPAHKPYRTSSPTQQQPAGA